MHQPCVPFDLIIKQSVNIKTKNHTLAPHGPGYIPFCSFFFFFACHFLQPVTVIWCLTVIIIKDTGFSTLLFVALSHVLQHLCATCRHMKYNSWKVLEGINA